MVCTDKNETVSESDEGDNCLTNTWKCVDVNNDKAVNILDVIKIYTKSGLKCYCD